MISVEPVRVFQDNYAWLWIAGDAAAVVDPGEAAPLLSALVERNLRLTAILITHHHPDHASGAAELAAGAVPVYGPPGIPGVDHPVSERDLIPVPGGSLQVLATPGHTRSCLCFYGSDRVFTGDTLFAAGCGRIFEETAERMQASLARLTALPAETQVYCGHEYTLANLAFAAAVEPENPDIAARRAEAAAKTRRGVPTVPSTLALELRTNPFLRWDVTEVRTAAERSAGRKLATPVEIFAAIREWKDNFRPS